MKKTFGLAVILKLAKVEHTDNGKEIKIKDLEKANEKVQEMLKLYNIKLRVG